MAEIPKKIVYSEPADYFPKELRKKYKLGEYAEENKPAKKPAKKTVKETSKEK